MFIPVLSSGLLLFVAVGIRLAGVVTMIAGDGCRH
jgi:hypothetical protein